jgi:hypothetical protein
MLNPIAMWQMVIDVCLVTSILVMAFRFAKSSRAQALLPRIVELEGRISVLMAETEGRAKHVSEQLARREQSLNRTISDTEKREKNIELVLSDAEALTAELSLLSEGARREALELERVIAESRSARDGQRALPRSARRKDDNEERDSNAPTKSSAQQIPEQPKSKATEPRRSTVNETNVEVSVEQTNDARGQRSSVMSLQHSYRAAEEMLKAGRDAETVSARTSLPLDGVQLLAQMIEIEREEQEQAPDRFSTKRGSTDPRLGALGVSRRPAPTV